MKKSLHCIIWVFGLLFTAGAFAQSIPVSGKVSSDLGEGMPGVSISVKGTTTGTATDANGMFNMNVPSDATLVFSFIGYVTEEVLVNNRSTINVQLLPDIKALSEVVVVGYGTQKRETLTGSVTAVQGKELVKSPQPNLSNSFAGRMPGVIATTATGEPGYDASRILIRGQATTGDNSPLIVIDGVANRLGGLDRLNPNDIESISVLKDGSAAIYGAQAANGVILITTKRGISGKPVFNYSYNQGFATPTRLPDMASSATYATILNEIDAYNGRTPRYTTDEIEKFANGSDPLLYPNTNWVKELTESVALQNQHNLSVRGGTDKVSYFLSLGKLHQDGIYKNGITQYDQYSLRSNVDVQVNERVKLGFDVSGRQEDRLYPITGANNIYRAAFRTYPFIPARYPNGMLSAGVEQGLNPLVLVTDAGGTNQNPRTFLSGLVRGSYQLPFLEGLSVDGFFTVDKSFEITKRFQTPWQVHRYDRTTNAYVPVRGGPAQPILDQGQINHTLVTANAKLNFTRQFGPHSISSFIAYEQSVQNIDTMNTTRRNFLTTLLPELSQGGSLASDRDNSGTSGRRARQNYFARVTYNYNEKYLAEFQFRYDGSTIFPKGKQFGFFPGISLGWRISEEGWFKDGVTFMSNLKLRASYGRLGNDRVEPFQYFDQFALQNGIISTGSDPQPVTGIEYRRLANPNITWETAQKYNVGLDATFFNNLTFELNLFKERRSNILTPRNISIPLVAGISPTQIPLENIGIVENQGFETQLGYSNQKGEFRYYLGGNFTFNKSKVIFLDEAPNALPYQVRAGHPIGDYNTYLMYNTLGIFRDQTALDAYPHVSGAKPGDLIFEDYNKDGQITAADRVRQDLTNVPQIIYGFNLGGSWKNFDVSILFQGQGRVRQYVLTEAGEIGNFFSTWADNRWSPTNPGGSYPRVDSRASNSISGGAYRNNFWFFNTAFLRLKNVEIGYNLPNALVSKLRLSGLRVYVNGFNLATFSKIKDFDPEGTSENGQFYPQQRIYNVGVNVSF
jgi:TonB-dependent starch-binding outer membrane protein SusC